MENIEITIQIPKKFADEVLAVNAKRFKDTRIVNLTQAQQPVTDLTMSDIEIVSKGVVSELLAHVRTARSRRAVSDFDQELSAILENPK